MNGTAHVGETVGQFYYLRFPGGILYDRLTFSKHGSHHDIRSARNRRNVKINVIANQLLGRGLHIAMLQFDVDTQPFQPTQMEINRPGANGATSGQGDSGPLEAGHQWT